jgi:hypothetical protein
MPWGGLNLPGVKRCDHRLISLLILRLTLRLTLRLILRLNLRLNLRLILRLALRLTACGLGPQAERCADAAAACSNGR